MKRRELFPWLAGVGLATGALLLPGHGSPEELGRALQSPTAPAFLGVVDERMYQKVCNEMTELGIPIDRPHSHYTSGATRLVINFAEKDHGLSAERVEEIAMIEFLLEHIGIGSIGIEAEVGDIGSDDLERIRTTVRDYETIRVELNGTSNRIVDPLVEHYSTIKRILGSRTGKLGQTIDELARASVNLELHNAAKSTMGTYVLGFHGRKPMFGLEDTSQLALAQAYARGLVENTSLIKVRTDMETLARVARQYAGNAEFQNAYKGLSAAYDALTGQVALYSAMINQAGFSYFNQRGFNKAVIDNRNVTWAQKTDEQKGSIVLTITGNDHTPGFTRELNRRKMSVITVDVPQ